MWSFPYANAWFVLWQGDKPQNLRLEQASLSPPRASEVTIKIRAVSLQVTGRSAAFSGSWKICGVRLPPYSTRHSRSEGVGHSSATGDLVPCSDGAGEIVAVGADVKRWKVGDRVCPNFALDHVCGDVTEETKATALGGNIDGVLREHINVPAYVRVRRRSCYRRLISRQSIVRIPEHLSYEEASTLP